MVRDSYRSLAQERIQFLQDNKNSKCYASVCSLCNDCAKLILLALLEAYGCTTPWHYSVNQLSAHCSIYIDDFTSCTSQSLFDLYEDSNTTYPGGIIDVGDVKETISDLNALIVNVNDLLLNKGEPLFKEIKV